MLYKRLCLLFAMIFVSFACFAELTADEAFERIFNPEETELERMFTREFLLSVPTFRLKEIVSNLHEGLGEYREAVISATGGSYSLKFDKGSLPAMISIDENGFITSLWFGSPEITGDSFGLLKEVLTSLDGQTSACVLQFNKDGSAKELLAVEPDKNLAVGSSFKLFLLKAIAERVNMGQISWNDLVELREDWKAIPTGILQNWPAGSVLTLKTLVNLMISLSDNTAADHIFNLLGREAAANALQGTGCSDVFNVSQCFKLKHGPKERVQEFINASDERKKEIIAETNAEALDETRVVLDKPVLIDVFEWFISTRALCEVVYEVDKMFDEKQPCSINTSALIDKNDWYKALYKGGSEPGVLNYTYLLQKKQESPLIAVSVTVNNSEKLIDGDAFNAVMARLLKCVEVYSENCAAASDKAAQK